ncbi:RNA polymerase II elongation factor Ell [Oopsacas minuta]|uniref:RNA polymerase II elongation factor Ell n=1 Tax=Oopsacas minuta TaxID=111878 RepID=A0AAV7JPG1_9METZ|nr:RNA polymerase II elongation factor Ell [Oopsacas minuta]
MNSLISNKEYELHFSDPSLNSGVSLFYLKLNTSSMRAIEQVIQALSTSRNPAPPPIKLEIGEQLSGTLTLPQISDERGQPSCSGTGCFSISLEPQRKPMELLHTLTTYPTHEDRSHIPGQRRTSLGYLPPTPDIFLNFLGPISHRMNIKATTGETFDRTRSQFKQLNEKSKDSAAIQLTNLPPEGGQSRRNKFDYFRGRQPYAKPFQGRNLSAKFQAHKRHNLTNGTLSPTQESIPKRLKVCKLISPPIVTSTKETVPVPSIPKRVSPIQKKRPLHSPSPLASPGSSPEPQSKRIRKESSGSSPKKHKKPRSGPETILPPDTLLEISKFQEQSCSWSDLYPDIISADIRASYRQTYDKDFSSYQKLRESVERGMRQMTEYKDKLLQLDSQSPDHKKLKKKATRLFHENKELRTMFSFLHDKLFVVKKQIELFDKSH